MKTYQHAVIMECGDQIRLHPDMEEKLRAAAARHGHPVGPIKTVDDYEQAVLAATSDKDLAVLSRIIDKVDNKKTGID